MRTKQKPGIIVLLPVIMASAIALTGALTGCGEKFRREKQVETEIVPEGSASGVTSTLLAPGEPAPPLAGTAPLTGTNADTTTSFTILDSNVSTSSTGGPGSLAGTLPLPSSNAPVSRPPSSSPPAGQSVISIQRSEPAPATSQAEPVPAAEPVPTASSAPATPAESEPAPSAAESELAEEEEEAGEPSPSPPPPSTTSTSTATNPD